MIKSITKAYPASKYQEISLILDQYRSEIGFLEIEWTIVESEYIFKLYLTCTNATLYQLLTE
jgi:hypothetical protein